MGGIYLHTEPADPALALRELGGGGDTDFYREMYEYRQMHAHLKMLEQLSELMRSQGPSEPLKRESP